MARQIINKWGIMLCIGLVIVILESCSHYHEIMKNGKESTADDASHNAGRNCMSCHHDASNEASGENRWWYFAGTVFKNNDVASSAGMIELWTGPGRTGEFLYKVPIDRSGNFYTAKIINFKGGFYPAVIGNDGKVKEMTTKTIEGACNSCHGVTEAPINLD